MFLILVDDCQTCNLLNLLKFEKNVIFVSRQQRQCNLSHVSFSFPNKQITSSAATPQIKNKESNVSLVSFRK
jgi:hypothetical protein